MQLALFGYCDPRRRRGLAHALRKNSRNHHDYERQRVTIRRNFTRMRSASASCESTSSILAGLSPLLFGALRSRSIVISTIQLPRTISTHLAVVAREARASLTSRIRIRRLYAVYPVNVCALINITRVGRYRICNR